MGSFTSNAHTEFPEAKAVEMYEVFRRIDE